MAVVMYGMSPDPTWPPIEPVVPWPPRVVPSEQTLPYVPPQGREVVVGPTAPETAEAVKQRIYDRIKWLENELRMHETWKAELATLRKMQAAYTDAGPTGGEGTKEGTER